MRLWGFVSIIFCSLLLAWAGSLPAHASDSIQDFQCGNRAFNVPDNSPWFRFHQACVWHDTCYSSVGYNGGKKKRYPKSWCDGAFRFLMEQSCHKYNPGKGCMRFAWMYFQAVKWFAHGAYNGEKHLQFRCLPDPRTLGKS